jgi:hypothetical protein
MRRRRRRRRRILCEVEIEFLFGWMAVYMGDMRRRLRGVEVFFS